MTYSSKHILIGLMALLLWSAPSTSLATTQPLSYYVDKYRNVGIHSQSLRRLAPYRELIAYFTSINYFLPRHVVNPDFLMALIIAESAADPRALSPKGARGLTQIMYPTGLKAARELAATGYPFKYVNRNRLQNLRPDDLYDPAINVLIACYLIARYNKQYQGRIDLVVAAWNAGEGAIRNDQPPNYQETLDLIGKVNGYYLSLLSQQRVSQR